MVTMASLTKRISTEEIEPGLIVSSDNYNRITGIIVALKMSGEKIVFHSFLCYPICKEKVRSWLT